MERCPTCRARLGGEDSVCPRCRSELASLQRAEAGAQRHCRQAIRALQDGDPASAAALADAALRLKRSPLALALASFLRRRCTVNLRQERC